MIYLCRDRNSSDMVWLQITAPNPRQAAVEFGAKQYDGDHGLYPMSVEVRSPREHRTRFSVTVRTQLEFEAEAQGE